MNTEKATPRCPQCGSLIPSEAIQGLCPRCVLQGATMGTDSGGRPIRSDPPTLEAIGAAFPQLEIQGLIGRGGMGFVYKARQPKLDRFVALKILPSELSAEPQFIGRFNREARALARLSHPNIVAVYDFGVNQGFCYLLMELVDGVNLRQAMQAGRFAPREALQIVPKICEALQFAHDQGVLHRDIKPENILLDAHGRVKIADFGIAKMAGDDGFDLALTQSGARLGTPVYMAPEQIEKPGDVDHRADIYSLGVVFYELLTGELPLGRFAPPSAKSTYDDERIDAIVMRALAKERELRQQSAGEVKTQVETVSASPPSDRSNPSASIPQRESPAGAEAPGVGAKAGGEENPVGKRIGRVLIFLGRVGVGLMLLTGLNIGWGLVTHPGGAWDGTQALVMLGVTLGSMIGFRGWRKHGATDQGVRVARPEWMTRYGVVFLVCGGVLVGAWYWWGFLAASTGTLNPKTVVSQPQPVSGGGVSDAPVVLDTEPSRVLVDAQGLPERLPEGEPSPAALKWHFAWKRLRERQHQADVGAVAPEGPEIRAARRDVAVAQAEFESNPASANRARLEYAEAMLTIVRKRFEVGRATESEVDEARLAAAEARAAMDGREPARLGVEPGILPSRP